jgi:hypothetical protein
MSTPIGFRGRETLVGLSLRLAGPFDGDVAEGLLMNSPSLIPKLKTLTLRGTRLDAASRERLRTTLGDRLVFSG